MLAIAPAAMLSTSPALAYIGPGTGLSALGALVALLATIVVAIAGFVWFPLRRLLRVRANARQRGRLPGRRPSP
ncbi:hypothetical protein [Arhodomonas sp. AD133]|uniref:hypothetical protein n=1 Tax=Arhodomonas sp. AD133 TaxID=3415009 RepID=UPI003EBA1E20